MSAHREFPRWLALPYAAWAYASFLILGLGVLVLIIPVPWQSLRRRLVRGAARLALWTCGMRVELLQAASLPDGPCVVVANHGSYLDGVVLYAALPPTFGFVIKREMSRVPGANLLLRRIGSLYVDRGSGVKNKGDTRELLKRAHAGGALAFFPEGTFHHEPGLAPFRPGAFVVAARAQLPIVPIAIRGTRRGLPAGRVLPQPCRIQIEIAPPLPPPGSGGADIAATVAAARSAILARIPEPDLAAGG
ncbi:MAG: lysophospholipid acyltransferase family protein [Steroidobacteraceae bacterium]